MKRCPPNESKMNDEKDKAVMLLVSNAMENTAAHGLGNIRRAQTLLRKVVWTMLFLFGFSMFAIQATLLISKYFSFGVDINIEVAFHSRAEFPAVTVCNMNPIKLSYLAEKGDENHFRLTSDGPPSNGNVSDGTPTSSWMVGSSTTLGTTKTSFYRNYEKYFDWNDVDYDTETLSRILMAVDYIAKMPDEELRATGHEITDMLLACSFNGYPCSPDNFTYFYSTLYGNCFTFNGGDSPRELYATKAGPFYGLWMELNVEQDEYEHHIQPAAGIRVTIHPKDAMPFPEDNGVSISPGQETLIGLRKKLITHLPRPYTNCTPAENISPDNIFLQQFPWIVYSRDACEKNCLHYEIIYQCNCTDPLYRYNSSVGEVCLFGNRDSRECLEKVEIKYSSGELARECRCTQSCSDTSYETTVSAATWPNKKSVDDVVELIRNTDELRNYYNEDPAFVENNFAKVMVFFNELTYEHVYDTEKYSFSSLLSDIGGQLGLWIGVSVMTVFEFVELIYDIALVFQHRRKYSPGGNNTGDNSANTEHNGQGSFDSSSKL